MDRETHFSKDFKSARIQLGYTQAELAAALNVEQATVSRWERGAEPTIEKLAVIAKFFEQKNVRFDYMWSILKDSVQEQIRETRRFVPLFCEIWANGTVKIVKPDSTQDYEAPPGAKSTTVCARMESDEYAPYFGKKSIVYFDEIRPDSHARSGLLAVCKTKDGYLFGERFDGASKGLHTLRLPGGVIRDIEIVASTPIWACRMR